MVVTAVVIVTIMISIFCIGWKKEGETKNEKRQSKA